ncbi:hypothetical protein CWO91_16820 [Bradyrhizobium genosp. SA-3]|uniref:hypothetical protein n=1 Tax=Bradyrhizobium genosp. SA-3 TaxID=508868 RepID=UPI001029E278|nr:hypothetical protein [Bradyrhizobium genosp. SA-3]RZN09691.1 hypothetical protein CWO91_16820 [Bradyrhizobium genosp. SA-3]
MKLSDIPWPGDVIARGLNEDEGAIALPGTPYVLTICYLEYSDGPEFSVVVRLNENGAPIRCMGNAFDLKPASPRGHRDERDPSCSRFDLPSLFELLAAVDYFAQRYGANPPE